MMLSVRWFICSGDQASEQPRGLDSILLIFPPEETEALARGWRPVARGRAVQLKVCWGSVMLTSYLSSLPPLRQGRRPDQLYR